MEGTKDYVPAPAFLFSLIHPSTAHAPVFIFNDSTPKEVLFCLIISLVAEGF